MAFPTIRLGLGVARHIFKGVTFTEVMIGEKTVGYEAEFRGSTVQNAAIVHLCLELWTLVSDGFGGGERV